MAVDLAAALVGDMEAEARALRAAYVQARQGIGHANRARTTAARSAAFSAFNYALRVLRGIEARIRDLLRQVGPVQMKLWGF